VYGQDYADLALHLASLPGQMYKRCMKCCIGRDLDKEEERNHFGFKSWSRIKSNLRKTGRSESQQKSNHHPQWRHGQKRSWQLVAMQSNTPHAGALDPKFEDETNGIFSFEDKLDAFTYDSMHHAPNAVTDGEEETSDSTICTLRRKLELVERSLKLAGSRNIELQSNLDLAGARNDELEQQNDELEQQVRAMARFENAQRLRVHASLSAVQPFEPASALANLTYDHGARSRAAQHQAYEAQRVADRAACDTGALDSSVQAQARLEAVASRLEQLASFFPQPNNRTQGSSLGSPSIQLSTRTQGSNLGWPSVQFRYPAQSAYSGLDSFETVD